jgi:hypothetical protein
MDDSDLAPLPTVSERLRGLKPSTELLEFYRQKIEEFDGEHADMLARLERYKATFEEQVMADLRASYISSTSLHGSLPREKRR